LRAKSIQERQAIGRAVPTNIWANLSTAGLCDDGLFAQELCNRTGSRHRSCANAAPLHEISKLVDCVGKRFFPVIFACLAKAADFHPLEYSSWREMCFTVPLIFPEAGVP
jgi:hypothetical protein